LPGEIRIQGLKELTRSFNRLGADFKVALRVELADLAEPTRADAEERAAREIRNIGDRWEQMRIGITGQVVYVAPKAHRRKGSPRPNLAPLLMDRAMQPALDSHADQIEAGVGRLFDRLAGEEGF